MKKIGMLLLVLLMPVLTAHAALMSVDSEAGPATAVLDTNSNKEWLKLSTTAHLTFNQVFAEMGPGGKFEGFHYPDYDELTCGLLGANAGIACHFDWQTFDVAPVWDLVNLFGWQRGDRIYHTLSTFNYNNQEERYIFGAAFYYYVEPRPEFEFDTQQVLLNESRLMLPVTHWLVRDAQYVAEPPIVALFAIGVVGLLLGPVTKLRWWLGRQTHQARTGGGSLR